MAGEGEEVKLLGMHVSPFVVRVQMALHMKGVRYEYIEQDLMQKGDLLLASNPAHKKVPVLFHGDRKPLCESLVIVEYVDEVWAGRGSPILPADPRGRAVARFWAAYVDGTLFPAWIGIIKAATDDERAAKVRETRSAVARLEELAFAECAAANGSKEEAAFFGGGAAGYLDLAVGCNLFWLEALSRMFGVPAFVDAGETPRLAAWAERFGETEAAKELVPDADRAVAYAKKLQVYWGVAN